MSNTFPWSVETVESRLSNTEKLVASDDLSVRHVFTQMFKPTSISGQSTRHVDPKAGPLAGAIVSVKDLFDVEGYVTRAGSLFMADDDAARRDADPVARLRRAGAALLGHTNMTELAYSGLGLNPHFGTPENALLSGCIPGGSTSGGAISVAKGFADIAVGTDTGGSVRIPAAFNGIVGFKPTQRTISRQGCKNLSRSLDSVGVMAGSVQACQLAYETMSATRPRKENRQNPSFVIPTNYGLDNMDSAVANAFDGAVSILSKAGFSINEQPLDSLEILKSLPVWQFSSVESRCEYDNAYLTRHEQFDPRVLSRMARADEVKAVEYRKTLNARHALIQQYALEMQSKVLLLPTVPVMPPAFKDLENDDEYSRVNLLALRNPSIANVVDGCSVSLPYTAAANTIGVMLSSGALSDYALLDTAVRVAEVFTELP